MAELRLHNKAIDSVFQLLGENENDITYSLGWALARSNSFLRRFLADSIGYRDDMKDVTVRLQHYQKKSGITDIEIELPDRFHVIVEAKRGWNLPGRNQLKKYALRLPKKSSPLRRILVLSECSPEYANRFLPFKSYHGIPVEALSWRTVMGYARAAGKAGKHAEKRLLQELISYLQRVTTMQDIDSNWVYVVALASGTKKGWGISFIDMVKKRKRYFHAMGINGWPKEPPNYIAFRYKGELQSIHHVENYKVVSDLHDAFPEIPSKKREQHFVYDLGDPIVPARKPATGKVYASGRVWCMFDTLFTCNTIAEARDLSTKRDKLAKNQG